MPAARKLLVPLLSLLLLAASVLLVRPPSASADPGCKGSNWIGSETGTDLGNGRVVVAKDTCETTALAARLRTEADALQGCVNVTGLAGTIASFFLGSGRAVAYLGAIGGFTVAGTCTERQITLRVWAGKLTEWGARCGDQGIKFRMGLTDNRILDVFDFACQRDALPDNDKALEPTAEDLNYTDGADRVSMTLVPSPHEDAGAPCTSEPYYFHERSAADGQDVYSVRQAQGGGVWTEFVWNADTGAYDIPAGTSGASCDLLPPGVPAADSPYASDYLSGGECWTAEVVRYSYWAHTGSKVVVRDITKIPDLLPETWEWTYDFYRYDRPTGSWVQWSPDVPPLTCNTGSITG